MDDSRESAVRCPDRVRPFQVEADQALNNHHDHVWECLQSFLLDT